MPDLVRRIGTLNCGHSAYPIIMGVSSQQYTPEQLEAMRSANAEGIDYDGRHYTGYEATQHQRALERAIRKQKRRILIDETTGDAEKLETDQIKLQMLRQEYTRFSKASGLHTQNERAEVAGFSWKQAGEADKAAREYYKTWSKSIGANDSIKTLAEYYDVKYNDPPRYELLQGYAKAVDKGDISPLVGFDQYERINSRLQREIVGITTKTGVTIESFSTHFIDRIIGQTSTTHKGMRRGVSIEDAIDALVNGEPVGGIRTLANGDIRQTLHGKKAEVAISVRDKRVIQTNPRRKK